MASNEDTTAAEGAAKSSGEGKENSPLSASWYDGKNREIVVYYLIAVAFLELIVGAVAFFYGVVHAEVVVPGGPRMAQFPWVGWLIAAVLSPVGLLLLLHLSGHYFSRSLNGGATTAPSAAEGAGSASGVVPERVERFYAIMRHAPTIVILLGLIGLGAALFFLDSAMDVVKQIGQALVPYLPWIVGGATVFLVICYLGRLWFVSRHNRMEKEFAYRMEVFQKTGIIIASEGCTPLMVKDGKLQALAAGDPVPAPTAIEAAPVKSLPSQSSVQETVEEDDVMDADIVASAKGGTKA